MNKSLHKRTSIIVDDFSSQIWMAIGTIELYNSITSHRHAFIVAQPPKIITPNLIHAFYKTKVGNENTNHNPDDKNIYPLVYR